MVGRVARCAEGRIGVVAGHRVEAGPQCRDLGGGLVDRPLLVRRPSAFSISAYCCTGGSTMPGATSMGATKSGGRVTHLVGRLRFLVPFDAAAAGPGAGLAPATTTTS